MRRAWACRGRRRAAVFQLLLALGLLAVSAPAAAPPPLRVGPARLDFGPVELGRAATRSITLSAAGAAPLSLRARVVAGPDGGFSAAFHPGGSATLVVVFEPYDLDQSKGTLTIETRSGSVRVALRGRGIDTISPTVTVETPRRVAAGSPVTIRFAGTDNDLVRGYVLAVAGRVIGRVAGPETTFVWRVPAGFRGRTARVTVTATDRAGNAATASSGLFAIR